METSQNPERLNPRARAANALVVAAGGYDGFSAEEVLDELRKAVHLIRTGRLDFGGAGGVWDFFRTTVDVILRKRREETNFQARGRELALKAPVRPETLGDIFQIPAQAFRGTPHIDVGQITAVVLESYAPELEEAVPPGFRPKAAEIEVAFDPEVLRRIVREELERAPKVEFRPEAGFSLTRLGIEPTEAERAPPPPPPRPETPEQVRREIEAPPTTPVPSEPKFPPSEVVRTYGKKELEATFKLWRQLFDQTGQRPPGAVYRAARERFQQVFRFPAPDVIPPEEAPPGLTLSRTPPPEAVREAAPAPAPSPTEQMPELPKELFEERAPTPLTEKYRPRHLSDVLGNPNVINRLRVIAKSSEPLPSSMVFTGPPGTGKTTVAHAFARDYLDFQLARRGAAYLVPEDQPLPKSVYFEVNAAEMKDDPTAFITNRVLPFIRAAGLVGGAIKKFLVFDDVANLSPENQKLLLRPLEQFGRTTTVIWISNDPMKHLPALESRSAGYIFRFSTLSEADVEKGLVRVAEGEGWSLPERVIHRVALAAQGDLRAGIGFLRAAWDEYIQEQGG